MFQQGCDITPSRITKDGTISFSIDRYPLVQVPDSGHGTLCPDGGSPRSSAGRSIISEGFSQSVLKRVTASVPVSIQDILICSGLISILNSEADFGPEWLCMRYMTARDADLQRIPA